MSRQGGKKVMGGWTWEEIENPKCDLCEHTPSQVRVLDEDSGAWSFMCDECWSKVEVEKWVRGDIETEQAQADKWLIKCPNWHL